MEIGGRELPFGVFNYQLDAVDLKSERVSMSRKNEIEKWKTMNGVDERTQTKINGLC